MTEVDVKFVFADTVAELKTHMDKLSEKGYVKSGDLAKGRYSYMQKMVLLKDLREVH